MTRTPILLAYCGRARVRLGSPPQDTLVHAYLRMPDDWRDAGVPKRTKGNAIFLGHDIPGISGASRKAISTLRPRYSPRNIGNCRNINMQPPSGL